MRLAELARDPTLVPKDLDKEDRSLRGGFIVVRVRAIRAAASDPTDIPDGEVPALRTQLAAEITKAQAAYLTIQGRVDADAAAGRLLLLANVDPRMLKTYLGVAGFLPGNFRSLRTRLVSFIVWWAVAVHPGLLNESRIEELHLVVDRRLRIVERMLYDIGRVAHAWKADEIFANPSGPWRDRWNRMFEYPRVPQRLGDSGNRKHVFRGLCNPDSSQYQVCQAPALIDWYMHGSEHLLLLNWFRVNTVANPPTPPTAVPAWDRLPPVDDEQSYVLQLHPGADPVLAIEKLFSPSQDFKERNLLFCDQVIHVLHMEALLWAKKKRSADTSWLTTYIGTTPSKLQITTPLWEGAPVFLAGANDGVYFEYERIHISNVQIGDHLIVYNHPAYDKLTLGGVWRLENAIVVQLYPKRYLQGHGTNPLTIDQMKHEMIRLFNREAQRVRARLLLAFAEASAWPSLAIPEFGTKHGENPWRSFVDEISRNTSRKKHVKALTFALEKLVPGVPAGLTEINFGGEGRLVRRSDPATSSYASAQRYADWWVRWPHDPEKDEPAIAASPTRRALAKQEHKVEYDATHGHFPLWVPTLKGGAPILNGSGKIKRIQAVTVTAEMVAAWTWYLPEDPAERNKIAVLRPKL